MYLFEPIFLFEENGVRVFMGVSISEFVILGKGFSKGLCLLSGCVVDDLLGEKFNHHE